MLKGVRNMKITLDLTEKEIKDFLGKTVPAGRYVWEPTGYNVQFDEACTNWTNDPEHNKWTLLYQQQYFNDLLRCRGHLFVNEILDALGMQRTFIGQLIGWTYNNETPICVDFGLKQEKNNDFLNGKTPNVWLEFNVNGIQK